VTLIVRFWPKNPVSWRKSGAEQVFQRIWKILRIFEKFSDFS
jgi:hypothetical protein